METNRCGAVYGNDGKARFDIIEFLHFMNTEGQKMYGASKVSELTNWIFVATVSETVANSSESSDKLTDN